MAQTAKDLVVTAGLPRQVRYDMLDNGQAIRPGVPMEIDPVEMREDVELRLLQHVLEQVNGKTAPAEGGFRDAAGPLVEPAIPFFPGVDRIARNFAPENAQEILIRHGQCHGNTLPFALFPEGRRDRGEETREKRQNDIDGRYSDCDQAGCRRLRRRVWNERKASRSRSLPGARRRVSIVRRTPWGVISRKGFWEEDFGRVMSISLGSGVRAVYNDARSIASFVIL